MEEHSDDSFEAFVEFKQGSRRSAAAPVAPAVTAPAQAAAPVVPALVPPAAVPTASPHAKDKEEANSNVAPRQVQVAPIQPAVQPTPQTVVAPPPTAAMVPKPAAKTAPFGQCPFCEFAFESGSVPRCGQCGAATRNPDPTKKASKKKVRAVKK